MNTNRPFKIRHKPSGYFYRPCTKILHESTRKWVKTNLSMTGGKIYTKDPRKHIKYLESHLSGFESGYVTDAFTEFEIVIL